MATFKKGITARQMVNQMKKKQDIISTSPAVYQAYLILGLQAAMNGAEIKATLYLYDKDARLVSRCPTADRLVIPKGDEAVMVDPRIYGGK